MDARFIFEQVQQMRPSSFSEEERLRYRAEKKMLRQFFLMKQQDELPDHFSVRDMKTWLLRGRSFLEEFQEVIECTGINHLFMAELAWTTARHFCLSQMEQEVLEELDREKRLSQLFSRKVTLEGLQMLVSAVLPAAKKDVGSFLPTLHWLLLIFGGIQIPASSARDAKPEALLELERRTAALVPEVVDTALRILLEEPEQEDKTDAASAEIGNLLLDSAAPCLSDIRSEHLLLGVCTSAARLLVKAVYKTFKQHFRSFHMIDYDESYYSARDAVLSAVENKEHGASLVEEVDTVSDDVDTCSPEETLVQDSAVQNVNHKVELSTSEEQKDQLLEERRALLEATFPEELEKELLEEREASPQVSPEEMVTMVTLTDGTEPSSTFDHKDQLLEKRRASPPVDEDVVTVRTDAAQDTSFVPPETNVAVFMEDKVELDKTETQDFLVQDCHKKKGVSGFFSRVWNIMTCCFRAPTRD